MNSDTLWTIIAFGAMIGLIVFIYGYWLKRKNQ